MEGFKSSFAGEFGGNINLSVEYLDLERFPNGVYVQQIVNLYNQSASVNSIDLVIAVAPGAYEALKIAGLEALQNVPVIAVEVGPADQGRYLPSGQVVELAIEWDPRKSFAHAFELFPGSKSAYIIGGCSGSDRQYFDKMVSAAGHFKTTHDITLMPCAPIDSVLKVIEYAPDSALVFMASYTIGADSTRFSSAFTLRLFSSRCQVPFFTMSDNFIDFGGFGGHIISFSEVGREVGKLAGQALQNGLTGYEKVIGSTYRYQYNWKELKRWELLKSTAIPQEATYFHEEVHFIAKYRWQIAGVVLLVFLQTMLIYYLIRLYRAQKKVALDKARNEILHRQLLREDRLNTMSQLTASLSHELNQPLAAILFTAQAGLRFLDSDKLDPQQAKTILSSIVEDDKRAGEIISSVKSLMKIETRVKEQLDISVIIKETLLILHSEINKQEIEIVLNEPNEPVFVFGDKIQLQQVVMNLLLNASIAMKDSVGHPKKIIISVVHANSLVTVSISDTGSGIDESLRETLFDAFATTRKEGMGIGLALCKSILQHHNGKIIGQNRPEGGATFSFALKTLPHEG